MSPNTMMPAAMGLTSRAAFAVFSEHETLRLQARVRELEGELDQYTLRRRLPYRAHHRLLHVLSMWMELREFDVLESAREGACLEYTDFMEDELFRATQNMAWARRTAHEIFQHLHASGRALQWNTLQGHSQPSLAYRQELFEEIFMTLVPLDWDTVPRCTLQEW